MSAREEGEKWDVCLEQVGDEPDKVMEELAWGLVTTPEKAKEVMEQAPVVLKWAVPLWQALALQNTLQGLGAQVSISPAK